MKEASSIEQRISVWSRLGTWLILLVGAVLFLGLLSASYSACFWFLSGILVFLLTWPARILLRLIANRMRTWGKRSWNSFLGILIIAMLVGLCLSLSLGSFPHAPLLPPMVLVKEYVVVIKPVKPNLSELQLHEQAILSDPLEEENTWSVSPPTRQITSTSRGLLLREVSFAPLQNAALGGTVLRTHTCRNASVELRDFPIGSLYAARDAENLKRYPYIDSETITWSVRNLGRGVVFSYIPPPFQHLRPVLAPFVGSMSLSQWAFGLLGFIGTILVTPIVKPVLLDVAKKRFKSWVEKKPAKSPKKTTTLIVSSKGEEKEVEIIDGKQ